MMEPLPEINPVNYDDHDISKLNEWAIEASDEIKRLKAINAELLAKDQQWCNKAERYLCEIEQMNRVNAELLAALEQNKTQWQGMVLALQTHGTNIEVKFFLDHFQYQIDANDAAINKAKEVEFLNKSTPAT
jgi:Ca2+-dependent lipid-binding protein